MAVASWAVPVGVLAGICVLSFFFVWWWFPRAFKRGTRQELDIIAASGDGSGTAEEQAANRAEHQSIAKEIVARALAREQALKRGEKPSDDPIVPHTYWERRNGAPPPDYV